MALSAENLGGRIDLLNPASLDEDQKKLYDQISKVAVPWAQSSGFTAAVPDDKLVGPFNLALLSPEVGLAFSTLQSVEEEASTLSPRIRQIVILAVGAIWTCDYERYAHRAVARTKGLSQATIDAIAEGKDPLNLSHEELIALQVTRQVFERHSLESALFKNAQSALGDRGLIDLLFLAGCYVTICSLLNSFEVPIPVLHT